VIDVHQHRGHQDQGGTAPMRSVKDQRDQQWNEKMECDMQHDSRRLCAADRYGRLAFPSLFFLLVHLTICSLNQAIRASVASAEQGHTDTDRAAVLDGRGVWSRPQHITLGQAGASFLYNGNSLHTRS
jgi:hypothetical protein